MGRNDDGDERTDLGPVVNLPGMRELREVVANVQRRLPSPTSLRRDGLAGHTVAIASVPNGMASGLLAGVNPLYGLYAAVAGPLVGGTVASTQRMVITTTSAAALVAGQALMGRSPEERGEPLFLMVVLAGIIAVLAGVLGLGRFTRFVSYSVMTGFLVGIAVILILSQLPEVVGVDSEGSSRIAQTLDLVRHLE